jgi:hypothetical protein
LRSEKVHRLREGKGNAFVFGGIFIGNYGGVRILRADLKAAGVGTGRLRYPVTFYRHLPLSKHNVNLISSITFTQV